MIANHLEVLELAQFASYLQPRSRNADKGKFGHVLIVGGDCGYSGAVLLAATAALRIGAGLVSVATQPEHAFFLNLTRPEIMCHAVTNGEDLSPLLEKATAVVVGPGLGRSAWAQKLLYLILKSEKNVVVDADALNLLATKPTAKHNWILTPHPGEAARLLKKTVPDIQQDRLTAIKLLQQQFGGVTVLKGEGSLILGPDATPAICKAGNPGMATAGTGDVLSGVIGGFIAQGMPLLIAAKLGVLIHAMAGDLAAKNGERGMIASDLFPYLRTLIN